jgi:hypothetical protein
MKDRNNTGKYKVTRLAMQSTTFSNSQQQKNHSKIPSKLKKMFCQFRVIFATLLYNSQLSQ